MKNGTSTYTTTCKFCGKPSQMPAIDVPLIGEQGKESKKVLQALTMHMMNKHPDEFAQGAAMLDDLLSFLVFNAYHHEDPSIPPRLERIRAGIFAQVRKNTITDASLQNAVVGIGLDPDDADKVLKWFKGIRDACCELGDHAPTGATSMPQTSPLIVPA